MKLDRKAHLVVLQEVARIKAGGKISDIAPDVRSYRGGSGRSSLRRVLGQQQVVQRCCPCACADRRFPLKKKAPPVNGEACY
ncbi:hypothetical protein LNO36_19085 [Klebsiella variicola subsp. variicola]|nr:hypothetical protein [Klebsiella variicola subsp. variicola]